MGTLTYGVSVLNLDDDLLWQDEHAWRAVEQREEYSITGALILEAAVKQAGRPITLVGGTDYGWMTRAAVETLRAWSNAPSAEFALVIRGEAARTVAFAGPVQATPIIDYSDIEAADKFAVTLRFIEV